MERVDGSPFAPDDAVRDTRRLADFTPLVPRTHRLKGMFLSPIVARIGAEAFEALRPELDEPAHERYLPFRDYPQADHGRLLTCLASRQFPQLPEAEALRRLARDDMQTLGGSTFGRVILAMVGDPLGALMRVPAVYEKVAPGIDVTAERGADHVTLEYAPLYGLFGYQLGQVEGIVRHFGGEPRTDVFEDRAAYRVRLVVTVT